MELIDIQAFTAGEMDALTTKVISGIVGPKAAAVLAGSISKRKILSGREVLQNLEKHMKTLRGYELHQLSSVNDGIFRHLEVEVLTGKEKENAKKNVEAWFDFLSMLAPDGGSGDRKELYKRSAGSMFRSNRSTSSLTLTTKQVEDLTNICFRLDPLLRARLETIREQFLKKRAVFRINSITATSVIPAAFREAGFQAVVTGQQYRAKVEVTLPKSNHLRFFVNYKDLMKESVLDEAVKAVKDLQDALSRLGGPVSIKKG